MESGCSEQLPRLHLAHSDEDSITESVRGVWGFGEMLKAPVFKRGGKAHVF